MLANDAFLDDAVTWESLELADSQYCDHAFVELRIVETQLARQAEVENNNDLAVELAAVAESFLVGRYVRLVHLTRRADLNGRIGLATKYLPDCHRLKVRVEASELSCRVRNLEPVTDEEVDQMQRSGRQPSPTAVCTGSDAENVKARTQQAERKLRRQEQKSASAEARREEGRLRAAEEEVGRREAEERAAEAEARRRVAEQRKEVAIQRVAEVEARLEMETEAKAKQARESELAEVRRKHADQMLARQRAAEEQRKTSEQAARRKDERRQQEAATLAAAAAVVATPAEYYLICEKLLAAIVKAVKAFGRGGSQCRQADLGRPDGLGAELIEAVRASIHSVQDSTQCMRPWLRPASMHVSCSSVPYHSASLAPPPPPPHRFRHARCWVKDGLKSSPTPSLKSFDYTRALNGAPSCAFLRAIEALMSTLHWLVGRKRGSRCRRAGTRSTVVTLHFIMQLLDGVSGAAEDPLRPTRARMWSCSVRLRRVCEHVKGSCRVLCGIAWATAWNHGTWSVLLRRAEQQAWPLLMLMLLLTHGSCSVCSRRAEQ